MIVASIICDKCGERISWEHVGKTHVIRFARMRGWSIGKKHLCPNCRK